MSGLNYEGSAIRKGATGSMKQHVTDLGGVFPQDVSDASDAISRTGGTPLVVSRDATSAGSDSSEGHCEGRDEGAVCADAVPWEFVP